MGKNPFIKKGHNANVKICFEFESSRVWRLLGKLNYFKLGSVVNKVCVFMCLEQEGLQNPAQCVSHMVVPNHFSFFFFFFLKWVETEIFFCWFYFLVFMGVFNKWMVCLRFWNLLCKSSKLVGQMLGSFALTWTSFSA